MSSLSQKARIKEAVRTTYANLATGQGCASGSNECCGASTDLSVPEESLRLSAGCGNPVEIASMREGEVVLDLGSGAGIDVFKASAKVGPAGRIIGVDSTPEMIGKAREIAERNGYQNVEFRLGEIEHMPVESNTVDVAISNCVLNLLPDKLPGFREIHRVLKPGGRLVVSDLTTRVPGQNLNDVDPSTWASCVAGAIPKDEYLQLLMQAGFQELSASDAGPTTGLISVTITGVKPRSG